MEIPVYVVNIAKREPDAVIKYLEERKGYANVVVKKYPIKKNSLIKIDGYLARLRGANEKNVRLKNSIQLVLNGKAYETVRRIEKYLEYNVRYEVDSKFEGFTDEDLNNVYDELYLKLKESVYNKRPAQQLSTLEKGREKFRTIEKLSEKAKLINDMLVMFRCDATMVANLKLIGGSISAGNMEVNKNTLTSKSLKLVHQSITGLFETEEELV